MSNSAPNEKQIDMAIRSLPAAPRILALLAARLQTLTVDIPEVTSILKRDSALTGLLINTANSAAYFGYDAATTIEEAVARIGFHETQEIIGEAASKQLTLESLPIYAINSHRLRENSLFCGLMMQEIARGSAIDPGTGYTVGLLRSMGKVVLDRMGRERQIKPYDEGHTALLSWEQLKFGITSAEVSGRTLALWDFPRAAVDAMYDHLAPAPEATREAYLLHLAATAADHHGFGLPGESKYWRSDTEACLRAGIDETRISTAAERAKDMVSRISPAFA